MDDNFRVVRRTDLPARARFNGSTPGKPHVRLHKLGNLHFSKAAAEIFDGRPMAFVSFDEETRRGKFTAVDKPPKGLEEQHCFPLNYHSYKGTRTDCAIAVKRLFTFLDIELSGPVDVPILELNPQAHSITVALPVPAPAAAKNQSESEEQGEAAAAAAEAPESPAPVR